MLHNTKQLQGYVLAAADGDIGHVRGFMVDDQSWAVRELIIQTGPWLVGKEILIASARVTGVSHEEAKVFVSLTKADIERTAAHRVADAGEADGGEASFPRE